MAETLHLQIKELRKIKNVTQKELAEAIHVSFQTISKWENGVAMPDISYLPALALYFDVDVELVLGLRPIRQEMECQNFTEKDYWEKELDCTKKWKRFYFNDDYLEFLVTKVWRFDRPIHMLDCACGYGYLAEKLFPYLPEGSRYTGFDISEMYLREAEKNFGADHPAIRFEKGDILDYRSQETYDLVISQMILSYLPEPEKTLDRMLSFLKPGGMLVSIDISLPMAEAGIFLADGLGAFQPDFPNLQRIWDRIEESGEMNWQTGTKMAWLFREKGLRKIQARLSDRVFVYDGKGEENDPEEIRSYQDVLEHLERFEKGYAFYLNRGCSLPEAEVFVKYQEDVQAMLRDPEVFVSKASGLYITWGYKECPHEKGEKGK